MSDIELVIKIPEEKYNMIKTKMYCGIYDAEVYKAIVNSTLIPKEHGGLIDKSDLIPDSDYEDGMFHAVSIEQINNALTIIEADKEV